MEIGHTGAAACNARPRRGRRALRAAAGAALLAAGLLALVVARGSRAAALVLDVTFTAAGQITVTLPDGTPVGTTSGAPSVVPAGFYTIQLVDIAGVSGPQFDLQGPGVNLVDNLLDGASETGTDSANLEPNATYTWRDDQSPSVVYSFATSGQVQGTTTGPIASGTSGTAESGGTTTSGAAASTHGQTSLSPATWRGTLEATVVPAGALALTFDGKAVRTLNAGRYTVRVSDRSRSAGFLVQGVDRSAITLSGAAFEGTRASSVTLTAGQWFYYPSFVGTKTYFVVVNV